MEVLEEVEVKQNQINFDFLNENATQTLEQAESFDWVAQETLVVIVKSNKFVPSNFEICGKKVVDWVAMAASGCDQKFVDDFNEDEILDVIRPYAEGYNFVAVLYSDCPLLQKQTFLEIMQYFSTNRQNVLKLIRGFVFRSEFLKTAKVMMSTNSEEFNKQDFVVVDDAVKVSYAFKVLNDRILDYHKKNGVVIFGESTVFIDADVEIEAGAIIYPNNIIKGESYIGKTVTIESGNYISDTIVCDDAFVVQSYLEKSKVESGKTVGPFVKLINERI